MTESAVRATRDAAISNLLRREISVVCDDTNLRQSVAREVAQIGRKHKAEIEVWDMTDVSLQTCLDRDTARREGGVGEDVIRGMHERYLKGRPWPLPLPEEPIDERAENQPYVPNTSLPSAVLVDVDGTVALRRGSRSPFDWARVGEDVPNPPVVSLVHSLARSHAIVFLSGRDGSCKQETYDWLYQHVIAPCTHLRVNGPLRLFMRAAGDTRKDAIVKRELFFEHVASKWNVVAVLDDRDQVVQMWRSLGLTCLQVADGAF